MMITTLSTSKVIDRTFSTGDLPILVTCNDQKQYICKYMRADSLSAYKLTSELIGSILAKYWNLNTPEIVFVKILSEHTKPFAIQYNHSAEAIGYQKINNAIDIANYINDDIKQSKKLFTQLLKIALFDFWIANEDRTCNNANMLYVDRDEKLISIDYGGIFNTNSYQAKLCQLSSFDSIIYADIFKHLKTNSDFQNIVEKSKKYYDICINKSRKIFTDLETLQIPKSWNITENILRQKINELFEKQWIDNCFSNYEKTLRQNF